MHTREVFAGNSLTSSEKSSTAELDPISSLLSSKSLNFDDFVKPFLVFAILSPCRAYALAERCRFIGTSARSASSFSMSFHGTKQKSSIRVAQGGGGCGG